MGPVGPQINLFCIRKRNPSFGPRHFDPEYQFVAGDKMVVVPGEFTFVKLNHIPTIFAIPKKKLEL